MKRLFYLVLFIFMAFFAMTIYLKNPDTVLLEYYFGISQEVPLVLVLIATFILGLLFGWLGMTLSVFKNKREVGRTKKQLAKVEKEVENLRSMPIKNEL